MPCRSQWRMSNLTVLLFTHTRRRAEFPLPWPLGVLSSFRLAVPKHPPTPYRGFSGRQRFNLFSLCFCHACWMLSSHLCDRTNSSSLPASQMLKSESCIPNPLKHAFCRFYLCSRHSVSIVGTAPTTTTLAVSLFSLSSHQTSLLWLPIFWKH